MNLALVMQVCSRAVHHLAHQTVLRIGDAMPSQLAKLARSFCGLCMHIMHVGIMA